MNTYEVIICGTYFGTITAENRMQAKQLFAEKYIEIEDKKPIGTHEWGWKESKEWHR